MTLQSFDFNQADGTVATTSTIAGSSQVTTSGVVHSAAEAISGATGLLFTYTAASDIVDLGINSSALQAVRIPFRTPSAAVGGERIFHQMYTSNNTAAVRFYWDNSWAVIFKDATASVALTFSGVTLTANTRYVLEYYCNSGSTITNGTLTAKILNAAGTQVGSPITTSAANLGSDSGTVRPYNRIRIGMHTTPTVAGNIGFDAVRVNDGGTAYIGPDAAPPPTITGKFSNELVATMTATGVAGAAGALTFSYTQISGPTTTPVATQTTTTTKSWEVTKAVGAPLVYDLTVSETGGSTATTRVTIPAAGDISVVSNRRVMINGALRGGRVRRVAPPTGNDFGFEDIYLEDFPTDLAIGDIRAQESGSGDFGRLADGSAGATAYGSSFKTYVTGVDTIGTCTYNARTTMSVKDSVLDIWCHTAVPNPDPLSSGTPRPVSGVFKPWLPSGYGDVNFLSVGVIIEFRMRLLSNVIGTSGYGAVALLIKDDAFPDNGELDWPERDFGSQTVGGFYHLAQPTTNTTVTIAPTGTAMPSDWHVYRIEWLPPVSPGTNATMRALCDGTVYWERNDDKVAKGSQKLKFAIQTGAHGGTIASTTETHLQLDWVRIQKKS